MLSISPSPNPQSLFSPKSSLNSNYGINFKIFTDPIPHFNKHLAAAAHRRSDLLTLNRGGGGGGEDPLVSNRRKLHWWPLSHRLQGNGEKHAIEPKQENNKEKNGITTDALQTDFLRYKSGSDIADVAGELQASIVSYKKKLPWRFINPRLQVDLVSAIHIADRRYFEILQEKLLQYDCVLYEGVGDKSKSESKEDDDMEGYNITGFIQRLMGRILSMEFQLDCLNYKGHNWYNADLDWDTFQRLQEERGETLLAVARDAVGSALKSDSDSSGTQFGFESFRSKLLRFSWIAPMPLAISLVINLTCSPEALDEDGENIDDFGYIVRELLELGFGSALKVILARSLTSVFASEIYSDLEENSVIIGERNKAALEELKKAIWRGEKRIAIFYGAGHMPDLGRRLINDFNMVPTDVDWVTAWSVRKPKSKYLGPFFQKYIGKHLPFSKEMGMMFVSGSVLTGILLLDLWLWWSAVNCAYWAGFQMIRLVQLLVIM